MLLKVQEDGSTEVTIRFIIMELHGDLDGAVFRDRVGQKHCSNGLKSDREGRMWGSGFALKCSRAAGGREQVAESWTPSHSCPHTSVCTEPPGPPSTAESQDDFQGHDLVCGEASGASSALIICVTLGKSPDLSEPRFSPL